MLTSSSNHPEYTEEHYNLSKEAEEHLSNNNHQALMETFSKSVDATTKGNIVNGGIHSPSNSEHPKWYHRKLPGWVHYHLIPDSLMVSVKKRYGNFVIERQTSEYKYEEMPIATRVGMHLLFAGYAEEKFVELNTIHHLFQTETLKQGAYFDDPKSVNQIPAFIQHYGLDMSQYEISDPAGYKTFNEFFARKVKAEARPVSSPEDDSVITSSADCRLVVFPTVTACTDLWVKGKKFTLATLLQDEALATEFEDASVAIFRLAPQDYHRYHAPASCTMESVKEIAGSYFTVNPCAVKEDLNVFTENHRCVASFRRPDGKRFAMVFVGALLVGTIKNTNTSAPGDSVKKGEEMGYFQYGGSTVIGIFPKGDVTWDDDLLKNSQQPVETIVHMGDHVGKFNQ
ncbi:phosphatidylserine decarboxylase-domain-containing protein [Umbelopsis sp. AD052]|nr:phosphatidylserine decarboxylase-domain-containing protein [Umbelopsis sp. AD052]